MSRPPIMERSLTNWQTRDLPRGNTPRPEVFVQALGIFGWQSEGRHSYLDISDPKAAATAAWVVSRVAYLLRRHYPIRLLTSPGKGEPLRAALLILPEQIDTDWPDLVDQAVGAVWPL